MHPEPLVWPGTGEELVWDKDPGRYRSLARSGPIVVIEHGTWQHFIAVYAGSMSEQGGSPEAALDALHARLCEQADALAQVTGRGTVGDIPTRVTRWQECTADPIYLLQSRRYVCKEGNRYTWGEDGEVWDGAGNEVDQAYMDSNGEDWEEVWETERVFFTREDADAYGEGHAYNYRDGWRSYSVPAMGQLRDMLRTLTTMAPDPRKAAREGGGDD